ncbi:MAG: lipocalin-like domain-containing protein, partial [Shewanella sp.]
MTIKPFANAVLLLALLLLQACERSARTLAPEASPHTASAASSMASILGQKASGDNAFAPVLPGYDLRFPQDHLAHDDFRIEWWYLTANLTTAAGEKLGAQWTQFRIALTPAVKQGAAPEPTTIKTSPWASNQLYFAHSALTSQHEHYPDEKWSRHHREFAGIQAHPFAVRLDNWRWQSQGDGLFPATLTVE